MDSPTVVLPGQQLLEAGLATVNIASATHRDSKRMIFLGNITPFDDQAFLTSIPGANYQNIPIDTIYIPDPHWPLAESFWQTLAALNGGTFTMIE